MPSSLETVLSAKASACQGSPVSVKPPKVGAWLAVVTLLPSSQSGLREIASFAFETKEDGEKFIAELKSPVTDELAQVGWKYCSSVLTQNTDQSSGGTPNPAQVAAGLAHDRGPTDV